MWKKLLILVAGSFMNFLIRLSGGRSADVGRDPRYVPVIDSFLDGFPLEGTRG